MNKLNGLLAGVAVAAVMAAPAAHALVWTTQLDYDLKGQIVSLGQVTVTDGLNSGQDVQVQVDLNQGAFVDTGKGHVTFAFNLDNSAGTTVTVDSPTGGAVNFVYENTQEVTNCKKGVCTTTAADPPPYKESPFGDFNNAFVLDPDGGNHTVDSPFTFTVHNAAGFTFAGIGATQDPDGLLATLGSGLHFESNTSGSVPGAGPGGWWFAADTSGTDGNCSPTCAIAGRDAIGSVVAVPEPNAWALMILGFGGIGALVRRRRTLAAA